MVGDQLKWSDMLDKVPREIWGLKQRRRETRTG